MSIMQYVQHLDGLPSPTGPLAEDLNSRTIRQANRKVQAVLREGGQLEKCGKYVKYDDASRAATLDCFSNTAVAIQQHSIDFSRESVRANV